MDVTFLAINYAPSTGGAQTLVRRVAEGLVQRHGHRVTVVSTDTLFAPAGRRPGRVPVGRELLGGVEVVRLPVARRTHDVLRALRRVGARLGRPVRPSVPSYGPWGARLALGARRAARAADVVVGVSVPFTTLPAAELFARRRGTAVVALPILHLGDWVPGHALVAAIARADRCVALTGAEGDWLRAHGVLPSRLAVVPPGCEPSSRDVGQAGARAELGLDTTAPVVAFVGRLAAHKGLDTLLAGCAELVERHPDVTVLVVGARTGWDGLEAALATLPEQVAARIVVHADVRDEVRDLAFRAADVVVVPSREEAFGMVIVEAWAAGRPVVASDLAAIASVVDDGVDGLLVPVGDAAALAGAVAGLLDDPARAAQLGAAGRARAATEFAWDAVVDRWHEELVAAVATRRRSPRAGEGD